MNENQTYYNPASWEANRSDVGMVILTATWSSGLAGAALGVGGDDVAVLLLALSGILGFITFVALSVIGCRLLFGRSPQQQAALAARRASSPGKARRSDRQVMALMALGIIGAVGLVAVIVALAS